MVQGVVVANADLRNVPEIGRQRLALAHARQHPAGAVLLRAIGGRASSGGRVWAAARPGRAAPAMTVCRRRRLTHAGVHHQAAAAPAAAAVRLLGRRLHPDPGAARRLRDQLRRRARRLRILDGATADRRAAQPLRPRPAALRAIPQVDHAHPAGRFRRLAGLAEAHLGADRRAPGADAGARPVHPAVHLRGGDPDRHHLRHPPVFGV